jgi:undecaprenyl-diphosphatase
MSQVVMHRIPIRGKRTSAVLSGLVLLAMTIYSAASEGDIDRSITTAINLATRNHRLLDHFFLALDEGPFLSGSILVGLVWYCWFQYPTMQARTELMIGTLTALGCGLASRLFQLLLPSHLRPLHDPLLPFQLPAGVEPSKLSGWSSFPSDHATVFAGLAYILYRSNPKAGTIAIAAAFLFDFARIYLGYHYTSDVIGGTALGVLGVALMLNPPALAAGNWLLRYETVRPGLFYMAAFILSFGLADLFIDIRVIASGLAHDFGFRGG